MSKQCIRDQIQQPSPVFILVAGLFCLLFLTTGFATDGKNSENSTPVQQGDYQGALDTVYPDWFKTSFLEIEEDIIEAREAGKRVMLVFHQPGCPYCNFFVERNLAQKDIESLVRSEFDAIEINMWGDREVTSVSGEEFTEKTFARQLKVQFTPTVLMFSKEGELALRINGYYPPDKFRAALDYVINDKNTQQSFTDYLASSGSGATANSNQVIARPVYISTDDFNTSDPITLVTEKTDKPYILLFEQKDCSNCELLHNTVLSASESRELLEKFDVVRVDMWGTDDITRRNGETVTGKELARQLQVSYAPTMILYAADHTEVIRSESWLKRFHTQSMLDYVQSDAWRHQPEFQRYLSERGDTIRESGQSVNILE